MKKNILVVFHDNKLSSGATKSFLSNVEYFLKKGHKVIAAVPNKNGDLSTYLNKIGIVVYSMNYGGNVYGYSKSKLKLIKNYLRCLIKTIVSLYSSKKLEKILINEKISVVYSNTSTCYFGAWIAKCLEVDHYWHFREFCFEDQNSLRIWKEHFIKLAKGSKKIFTISKVLNNYYINKYVFSNTKMLYNDISPLYINDSHIKHDNVNILITGTISEAKGQIYAIKAIEKLSNPSVKLFIAGEVNEYARSLMEYTKNKNIKNIEFCGLLNDMKKLREKVDMSIVCAKQEAFGRTIIEDMLNGIIVIGCDSGAVIELVRNYETGYIYKYGDIDDLCNKIVECIDNTRKKEIRANAFQFAKNFTRNFTAIEVERMVSK